MTEADDRMDGGALRPAWKRRSDAEGAPGADPLPAEIDEAELERGRTLAVIAAIGRLQMSLDVLVRHQQKHAEAVEARLARIERALSERR